MSNTIELRIYDRDFNFLGVMDGFTSLVWTRKYFEVGSFQLVCPLTDQNVEFLKAGNILWRKNEYDVLEAGIVEYLKFERTSKKKKITCKGRFLSSYLSRRLTLGIFTWNGTIEGAMRALVTQMTSMPMIELGDEQGFEETVTFQATYKTYTTMKLSLHKRVTTVLDFALTLITR